jgi:ribonucleoside-diphosphate reductase alpha chain
VDVPAAFVTALDIRPEDHLAMVAAVQPYVDGAISKTLNLPAHTSAQEVADLFMQAWRQGLKGLTVFRNGGMRSAVLHAHDAACGQAGVPQTVSQHKPQKTAPTFAPDSSGGVT